MRRAIKGQKFQDWFTQQWAICTGRKIIPANIEWLMGPFGKIESTGDQFINQLAEAESLVVNRNQSTHGLIASINDLDLTKKQFEQIAKGVIDFYENTASYHLDFSGKWNPLFRGFGILVNRLFSNRIEQLNIPTNKGICNEEIDSELIALSDPKTGEVKYTIWFRTFKKSRKVIYSGVYSTCKIPSGQTCIKAVFPLPNGNATVIMSPSVLSDGSLRLNSSGRKFGEAGFYFLLNDAKGNYWSRYIRSFRDELIVSEKNGMITAKQKLKLWGLKVVQFNYDIKTK